MKNIKSFDSFVNEGVARRAYYKVRASIMIYLMGLLNKFFTKMDDTNSKISSEIMSVYYDFNYKIESIVDKFGSIDIDEEVLDWYKKEFGTEMKDDLEKMRYSVQRTSNLPNQRDSSDLIEGLSGLIEDIEKLKK